MNPEIQSKNSFDQLLSFSRITQENWLLPDRKDYLYPNIKPEEWITRFLEPRLEATVPDGVIKLFEIARGAMIYSWFFYPLATLGFEQCTRVAEFAIRERVLTIPQEPGNFFRNIKTLAAGGVISAQDEPRWQALRNLRNARSHLKSLMLIDEGQAAGNLRTMAELINGLF